MVFAKQRWRREFRIPSKEDPSRLSEDSERLRIDFKVARVFFTIVIVWTLLICGSTLHGALFNSAIPQESLVPAMAFIVLILSVLSIVNALLAIIALEKFGLEKK